MISTQPIAVYYEHPKWFAPLFHELDRRGIAYDKIAVQSHLFDPAAKECPYSVIVNRVSAYPSKASHPNIILYVKQFLSYLDRIGARVINGVESYRIGTSKALQVTLLDRLNLRYPETRVIHHPGQAPAAASELSFPVLVKPNIGGSGAGIRFFPDMNALNEAVSAGEVDMGIDHTALVQEYIPAKDQTIHRVEILNGKFLYAIRLPMVAESFNYCPADGCLIDAFDYCPVDGAGGAATGNTTSRIASFMPPAEIIEDVKRILAASRADLGGVEYIIHRDHRQPYYYDINPLSNFVADAPHIVGFDPVVTFVDYILEQADRHSETCR